MPDGNGRHPSATMAVFRRHKPEFRRRLRMDEDRVIPAAATEAFVWRKLHFRNRSSQRSDAAFSQRSVSRSKRETPSRFNDSYRRKGIVRSSPWDPKSDSELSSLEETVRLFGRPVLVDIFSVNNSQGSRKTSFLVRFEKREVLMGTRRPAPRDPFVFLVSRKRQR